MTNTLSPENDTAIFKNYSSKTLKAKVQNKLALQKELELEERKDCLVIALTTEFSDKQESEVLLRAMHAALHTDIQLLVIAKATKKYQELLEELNEAFPQKMRIISDVEENRSKLYAASDASIYPNFSKESELELTQSMAYGVVPIAPEHMLLSDFNAVEEKGNAFVFAELNEWTIFEAVVRAKENYKFPYDWKNLQVAIMSNVA